jgi:NAD(P)-dependent dehydrogenase (short-subunit alcohol dehydrogenase family)
MKYILLLLISYIIAIRSDVLAVPKSLKQRSQLIGGFGAIVALAAGKYFIDGPTFNEPVSLVGKTVAITGANTGLGKETAIKLSSLGAQTILLCRPSKKTDDAVDEIKKISGNDQVSYIPLDLADMKSIRECARILKSKISKLDILINNAGVMAIPKRETTKNGFEMQLGVNHLGHFLLTNELFDLLKKGNRSRYAISKSNIFLTLNE